MSANNNMQKIITKFHMHMQTYAILAALAGIWIFFTIASDGIFISSRNISNLLRQMSIVGFLSLGMLMVILTGGIDLSVGSVTGFISVIVAFLQAKLLHPLLENWFGLQNIFLRGVYSTIISIVIALMVGALIGMYQGILISYVKIPAFIVTLGGMLLFRGGVIGITQGKTIVPVEESTVFLAQGYVSHSISTLLVVILLVVLIISTMFKRVEQKKYNAIVPPVHIDVIKGGMIWGTVVLFIFIMQQYRGVPFPVLLLAIAAVKIHYLTRHTRFGHYLYAIGGNPEAARLSGINLARNIFTAYACMGVTVAVSGIILTGYVAAGTTSGGTNYELDAIASCVIGGASLVGGKGTVIGAVLGALVIASITNGMSVMNLPAFWQYIVKGIVLILAVYVDTASRRKTA